MKKHLNDGTLVDLPAHRFNIGDFVDVTATLDIVQPRPNAVQVHFNLTSIIQLTPAVEMEIVSGLLLLGTDGFLLAINIQIRPLLSLTAPETAAAGNASPCRRGRDYHDIEAETYAADIGLDLHDMHVE